MRRHDINLDAFVEPFSAEAIYWLGFLLADGCIYQNRVQLSLKEEDVEHVRAFARFVGADEGSVKDSRIIFVSNELVLQLSKYGIVPKKSGKEVVPASLAYDRDFWRGVVDGDGSLGFSSNKYPLPRLSLCGSRQVLESFARYLLEVVGFSPAVSTNRSIFQLGLSGKKSRAAISTLYYPGCFPALSRKRAIAEKCTAWKSRRFE